MAITSCKDCGNEISTTAKACPKCGAELPKKKIWPWVIGTPLALMIFLMLYGATIPDYMHRAREVRDACEKLTGPFNKMECQRIYDRSIAEAKARGEK